MAEEICNVEDAEDMGTKRRKLEVPESEGLQQAHAHLSLSQHSLRKKDGEESETRSKSKREGEEEKKYMSLERIVNIIAYVKNICFNIVRCRYIKKYH